MHQAVYEKKFGFNTSAYIRSQKIFFRLRNSLPFENILVGTMFPVWELVSSFANISDVENCFPNEKLQNELKNQEFRSGDIWFSV